MIQNKNYNLNVNILQSNSAGNCTILDKHIMIDIGTTFKLIKEKIDVNDIKYLFITHHHSDHLKLSSIRQLQKVNPDVKIICNKEVASILNDDEKISNVNVVEIKQVYKLKYENRAVRFMPFKIYHKNTDGTPCLNYGYDFVFYDNDKCIKNDNTTTLLFATDSNSWYWLRNIGYRDIYVMEANYCHNRLDKKIKLAKRRIEKLKNRFWFIYNKEEFKVWLLKNGFYDEYVEQFKIAKQNRLKKSNGEVDFIDDKTRLRILLRLLGKKEMALKLHIKEERQKKSHTAKWDTYMMFAENSKADSILYELHNSESMYECLDNCCSIYNAETFLSKIIKE